MKRPTITQLFLLTLALFSFACGGSKTTPTPAPQGSTTTQPVPSASPAPAQPSENLQEPQAQPEGESTGNSAPIIQTKSLPQATEDVDYTFQLEISDPEGDPVFAFIQRGPENLALSQPNFFLRWLPKQSDIGTHRLTIIAIDSSGASTQQPLELEVAGVNDPPVIAIQDQFVFDEGETIFLTPVISDEDGDLVSVTYSGWMNSARRVLSFQDSGVHEVRITADDGQSSVQKDIRIIVNDLNLVPTISGLEDLVVNEGDLVTLNPVALDRDGDPVQVVYTGWMNSNTRQTAFDDAGLHTVTVWASDGVNISNRTIQITVLNVNRPPVFNLPQALFSLDENELLRVPLPAQDPDGNGLRYELVGNPLIVHSLDSQTGLLTILPQAVRADSVYQIQVRVSDDEEPPLSAVQDLEFRVANRWTDAAFVTRSICGCDPKVHAGIGVYCTDNQRIIKRNFNQTKIPSQISDPAIMSGITSCPRTHNGGAVWTGIDAVDGSRKVYYHNGLVTQTINAGNGYDPDLFNGEVVWVEGEGDRAEIKYYRAGGTIPITQDDWPDMSPRISSGGIIVWLSQEAPAGTPNESSFYDVHYFGGALPNARLTTDILERLEDLSPVLGNDQTAWVRGSFGIPESREIYLFNGALPAIALTDNEVRDDGVFVDDDGMVVWYQSGGEQDGIYSYDGNRVQAITGEGAEDINPAAQKGMTVWRRNAVTNGLSDFWIMAFVNGKIYVLDKLGRNGDPYTDGKNIVWRDQFTRELWWTQLLP